MVTSGRVVDRVVSELAHMHMGMGRDLPSKLVLCEVTDHLVKALFPRRLGESGADTDGYVRRQLDAALGSLAGEVATELAYGERDPGDADGIVERFANGIPQIRRLLNSDVEAAYEGDPAARSYAEVLVCYPGVHAMIHHRIAHSLLQLGVPFIARVISELGRSETGIDIHPAAVIGEHFFIDHGTGVVIGETAVVGDRVRLYQHVTLGAKKLVGVDKGVPRHPIVENDVVIYAGATVLGRVTIGRGSVIGGGVWVTQDVPPGSVLTQAQTRQETFLDGSGI